jgi:hypothetical protein
MFEQILSVLLPDIGEGIIFVVASGTERAGDENFFGRHAHVQGDFVGEDFYAQGVLRDGMSDGWVFIHEP